MPSSRDALLKLSNDKTANTVPIWIQRLDIFMDYKDYTYSCTTKIISIYALQRLYIFMHCKDYTYLCTTNIIHIYALQRLDIFMPHKDYT